MTARSGTDIDLAVGILQRGGVIGLPTETVYGLGADASNVDAVERIFDIKGRPADHPLIVHIIDIEAAQQWSSVWTDDAQRLAEEFWPGPLTIIVARAPAVPDAVTGGRDTVALRCPAHPMMREVLARFRGGIAAPSANRFGRISPTTAAHVLADLGDDVEYVLDGGPCSIGLESTIVDCTVHPPQILRPGAITLEQIQNVLGATSPASGPSRAPGMLESHYAPTCRVHPCATQSEAEASIAALASSRSVTILDASRDPEAFAITMYADLRSCDDRMIDDVFVIMPPAIGIGAAIHDRIAKAAASH